MAGRVRVPDGRHPALEGGLPGEAQIRGLGPAALQVGLPALGRGAEYAQPGARHLVDHQGEGPQQRDEVLDRVNPAHPGDGRDLRLFGQHREAGRVHPVVDGADAGGVRAEFGFPALVVDVAGGDDVGLLVAERAQAAQEAQVQVLHRPAELRVAQMQVMLAHVHAVLGDDHRQPVPPLGRHRGQGAEPVRHRVHHVRPHRPMRERAQRMLEKLQRDDRVAQGGHDPLVVRLTLGAGPVRGGGGGLGQDFRPALPPCLGQQAHRGLAGQGGPQVPGLRVVEHLVHHVGEPVLGLVGRAEQHVDQLGQRRVVPAPGQAGAQRDRGRPAPQRDRRHGRHVGRERPADGLVPGGDQRDHGELMLRQPADQLVAPDADAAELVRVGTLCCQCHSHVPPCRLRPRFALSCS